MSQRDLMEYNLRNYISIESSLRERLNHNPDATISANHQYVLNRIKELEEKL